MSWSCSFQCHQCCPCLVPACTFPAIPALNPTGYSRPSQFTPQTACPVTHRVLTQTGKGWEYEKLLLRALITVMENFFGMTAWMCCLHRGNETSLGSYNNQTPEKELAGRGKNLSDNSYLQILRICIRLLMLTVSRINSTREMPSKFGCSPTNK